MLDLGIAVAADLGIAGVLDLGIAVAADLGIAGVLDLGIAGKRNHAHGFVFRAVFR